MVMMVSPASVNFNAPPETNFSRRSFIPVGEVGEFAKSSGEFTPEELEVIRKTPFLASRIEAAYDKGTIIGYRDSYKNRSDLVEARQAYNFAVNNPKEFYKSEFPAYLGSNDPTAATQLVQTLYDFGETPDNLKSLYESSLVSAPDYSMTYDEKVAINRATQGANDPLGLQQYLKPIFTTIGAIAGGPIGAAVMNSLLQLGETGKIDLKETATAAATAYVGQEVFGPTVPETSGVDYSLTGGGADAGGTGFQGSSTEGFTSGATPPPPTSLLDTGLGSINYNLLEPSQLSGVGETGLTLGAAGEGLQLPTVPALPSMGGGQGLVVPVEGGFVTETGFTPVGATPSLGDPDSFINDPEVLGQPVIQDVENLSLTDALRGLRLANQLMSGQQQTGAGVPQQQAPLQTAGVDYSGILGLLGRQASMPNIQGLLGPAQIRYPNSLLG
jgi:hypothetical protein